MSDWVVVTKSYGGTVSVLRFKSKEECERCRPRSLWEQMAGQCGQIQVTDGMIDNVAVYPPLDEEVVSA